MNTNFKKLVEEAGFSLWEDEPWKPEGAIVDWGANYDRELETLCQLIVDKCIEICKDGAATQMSCVGVAYRIGLHFKSE